MSDTTTPYQIRNHPDFESQKQTYLEMQANGEIPTMSDTTTLRDHSQPCEHGWEDPHEVEVMWEDGWLCPGGRERTFKYFGVVPTEHFDPDQTNERTLWVEVSDE